MAYVEVVGYIGSDPNARRRIPFFIIDVDEIKKTPSLPELYALGRVKVPSGFNFEFVEVRLADKRYRLTFDGSKWTESPA